MKIICNLHAGNIRHAVHATKSLIMHEGLNYSETSLI